MAEPSWHEVRELVAGCREDALREALGAATASYWLRRADEFDRLRVSDPRPGKCDEFGAIVAACRNRARLALDADGAPDAVTCPWCFTDTSPWRCSCGSTRLPELVLLSADYAGSGVVA